MFFHFFTHTVQGQRFFQYTDTTSSKVCILEIKTNSKLATHYNPYDVSRRKDGFPLKIENCCNKTGVILLKLPRDVI